MFEFAEIIERIVNKLSIQYGNNLKASRNNLAESFVE